MKPQCATTADCLRELARVMDQFGIGDALNAANSKYVRCDEWRDHDVVPHFSAPSFWKFAIAEVEGKPVFIGDELYQLLDKVTIIKYNVFGDRLFCQYIDGSNTWLPITELSWSQPKPKTVMVEMLVEDAKHIVMYHLTGVLACKKALEAKASPAMEKLK